MASGKNELPGSMCVWGKAERVLGSVVFSQLVNIWESISFKALSEGEGRKTIVSKLNSLLYWSLYTDGEEKQTDKNWADKNKHNNFREP